MWRNPTLIQQQCLKSRFKNHSNTDTSTDHFYMQNMFGQYKWAALQDLFVLSGPKKMTSLLDRSWDHHFAVGDGRLHKNSKSRNNCSPWK